jgi:DNA-binding response OmpR family regulator
MGDLKNKRILVIDDDPILRQLVAQMFSREGANVTTAANGAEGLRHLFALQPHLVILDVMMPAMNGWEVCREIRRVSDVPIIFVTALSAEADRVRGLDCGAVDYMVKPFKPESLLERARSELPEKWFMTRPQRAAIYSDDHLRIDLDTRQVLVRGQHAELTDTEFELLAYLLRHAGRVLTPEQILENVWSWEYQGSVNYIHIYISRLRQKLEEDPRNPRYLLTEQGIGYRFHIPSPIQTNGRQEAAIKGDP